MLGLMSSQRSQTPAWDHRLTFTRLIKLAQGPQKSHFRSSPAPKLTGKGKLRQEEKNWGAKTPGGCKSWGQSNTALLNVTLKAQHVPEFKSRIVIVPRSQCLQRAPPFPTSFPRLICQQGWAPRYKWKSSAPWLVINEPELWSVVCRLQFVESQGLAALLPVVSPLEGQLLFSLQRDPSGCNCVLWGAAMEKCNPASGSNANSF